MVLLVRDMKRQLFCLCGDPCTRRTLHDVLIYVENAAEKLALRCVPCGTVTLLEFPYPRKFQNSV